MPNIVIYTAERCSFCLQAKQLLEDRGVTYTEVRVDLDPVKREEMIQGSGQRTVPQIFIGDQSIGGFTELAAMAHSGELDRLLKES